MKLEAEVNRLISQDKEEEKLAKSLAPAPAGETAVPFSSSFLTAAPTLLEDMLEPTPSAAVRSSGAGSPPKSRRLGSSSPKINPAEPGDVEAQDFKIHCINLPIIIIYYCATADVRGAWPAIRWMFCGLGIALIDLVVLIALSTSNNWASCSSHDDCSLGTLCVHLPKPDGGIKDPKCFDCCEW